MKHSISPDLTSQPEDSQILHSRWFATFLQYTDQKLVTANALDYVLQQLMQQQWPLAPSLLDVGCGKGELAATMGRALKHHYSAVSIYGIDQDEEFVKQTENALLKVEGLKKKIIKGNCFNVHEIHSCTTKAGLILASNVAYYTQNVAGFLNNLYAILDKKGVLLLIHESPLSQLNYFRTKYGAAVNTNTVGELESAMVTSAIPHVTRKIYSRLTFPPAASPMWDAFKNLPTSLEGNNINEGQITNQLKLLLEFVVQTPLKELQQQGKLIPYLEEVQSLISKQNNQLLIISSVQFALSASCTQQEKDILQNIAEAMEEKFLPVTQPSLHSHIAGVINSKQKEGPLCPSK